MQTPERELLILSTLLYNTILTPASIPIPSASTLLHKMEKERKVKEHTINYKAGIKNRRKRYYTLTDTGLYFLLDYPQYLPFPIPSTSFPYQYLPYAPNGKTIANLLHEVTANIFFSTFPNCTTFPIFFSMENEKEEEGEDATATDQPLYNNTTTKKESIYSLLEPTEKTILSSFTPTSFPSTYLFTPSCIFRHIALKAQSTTTYRDLCYSQFSGILSNSFCSYLVYTASSDGLSWNRKILDIEKRTRFHYNYQHGISTDSPDNGILLFRTPTDLLSVYNDAAKRRTKTTDITHSLYSLYALPMDGNGRKQIEHLLFNDVGRYRETFLHTLTETKTYIRNPDKSSPFPLLDKTTNSPCYYGFDMDIISLKNLPFDTPFTILCRSYQIPYYKTLFPNAPIKAFT